MPCPLPFLATLSEFLQFSTACPRPLRATRFALICKNGGEPIFALIAALLGFGGIAGDAAHIARVVFMVFVVLLLVSVVLHLANGKTIPPPV